MNANRSDPWSPQDASCLALLNREVASWVKEQFLDENWAKLFKIQVDAIKAVCTAGAPRRDLILSAPTAGGKTLAAFLPLLSQLMADLDEATSSSESGFRILYVSPLKALLQQMNLDDHPVKVLHRRLNLRYAVWHGDIEDSKKSALTARIKEEESSDHDGLLPGTFLTTPESLEGRLICDPSFCDQAFGHVDVVIIDELHSYFETPRGRQLMSLIARLQARSRAGVLQRVALSATLGNRGSAADEASVRNDLAAKAKLRIGGFLRPDLLGATDPEKAIAANILELHEDPGHRKDLRSNPETGAETQFKILLEGVAGGPEAVARKISNQYARLTVGRPTERNSVLVFCNSKHDAETYEKLLSPQHENTLPNTSVQLPITWFTDVDIAKAFRDALVYLKKHPPSEGLQNLDEIHIAGPDDFDKIIDVLDGKLRALELGTDNAGRVATVRSHLNKLKRCVLPNLYLTHHASRIPADRAMSEKRMRSRDVPSVVFCTTTLELGIDIGPVDDVCQIQPAPSVTALRQRLGRSRREAYASHNVPPPMLTIYLPLDPLSVTADDAAREEARSDAMEDIWEPNPPPPVDVEEQNPLLPLQLRTFQSVAQVMLLRRRAYETPADDRLDVSTLAQQIVNFIGAETNRSGDRDFSGVSADTIETLLCRDGPFRLALSYVEGTNQRILDVALDALCEANGAAYPRLWQDSGSNLYRIHPENKDWQRNPSIYAAFSSPKELTVRSGARVIGTLSARTQLGLGDTIVLGGQSWMIISRDVRSSTLHVRPGAAQRAPHFPGSSIPISSGILTEMHRLYSVETAEQLTAEVDEYVELNANARASLLAGFEAAKGSKLVKNCVHETRFGTYYMPWLGPRHVVGITTLLNAAGLRAVDMGCAAFVAGAPHNKIQALVRSRLERDLHLPKHEWLRGRVDPGAGKFTKYLGPLMARVDASLSDVSFSRAYELLGVSDLVDRR